MISKLVMAMAGLLVVVIPACNLNKLPVTPSYISMPKDGIVLPTQNCGDLFFITAMINGQDGFNLILDTGTPGLALSNNATKRLWPNRSVRHHIEELKVGEYIARDFGASVYDLSAVSAVLGERIDGLLGFRIFAEVLLTFDYPNREVKLKYGALESTDDHTVKYSGKQRPFIKFQTTNVHQYFLLDTGSTSGIGMPTLKKLLIADKPIAVSVSATVRGAYLKKAVRLKADATLGPLQFSRPIIQSRNKKTHIIGTKVLNRFALTFDQKQKLVRFNGPIHKLIETDPIRTQGYIIAPKGDNYRVVYVIENSPADEAGIEIDDYLVAIDGEPITMNCESRNRKSREQTKKSHSLVSFKRGDKRWSVELRYIELLP